MGKEVRIHLTANNLTESEYEKLIATLEGVPDYIKVTSEEPIITLIENEKSAGQTLKSPASG